ncbi:MAG: 2-C-methyl-D-erythritol 4-phosphate cytidylyltransferase [Desulfotomaculum sp.]|nr:2-C-methyl-D-erythritol 4-phosphate cytidylyltransferase [Desulfotomaculum sp.]
MVNVYAVIPAAGVGSRMKSKVKKQYLQLKGLPVLVHTIKVFEKCPVVKGIVLVVNEKDVLFCTEEIVEKYKFKKVLSVVPGGECRQHSVYNGLKKLPAEEEDIVAVHDGARPLVTENVLLETISAARKYGAAVTAVPVKDTIKFAEPGGKVIETPPRDKLWAVQTPQVFKYGLLLKAYREAFKDNYIGTDDSSLVERMGLPVYLISGSYENIKITTPDDMLLAEAILDRRSEVCE